jgi:hypothetical protein
MWDASHLYIGMNLRQSFFIVDHSMWVATCPRPWIYNQPIAYAFQTEVNARIWRAVVKLCI